MISQKDMTRFFSPDDQCPVIKLSNRGGKIKCTACKQIIKRDRSCNIYARKKFIEERGQSPTEMQYLKHISSFGHWVKCEYWEECLRQCNVTLNTILANDLVQLALANKPDAGMFVNGKWLSLREAIHLFFGDPDVVEYHIRKYKSEICFTDELSYENLEKEMQAAHMTGTVRTFMNQLGHKLGLLEGERRKELFKIEVEIKQKRKDPRNILE